MSAIVCLAGVPGCGKSTLALALKGFSVISRDNLWQQMFTDEQRSQASHAGIKTQLDAAGNKAIQQAVDLAAQGQRVILDGFTFRHFGQYESVRDLAAQTCRSIIVKFVYLEVPISIAQKRVMKDLESGAHPSPCRDADLVLEVANSFRELPVGAIKIDSFLFPTIIQKHLDDVTRPGSQYDTE